MELIVISALLFTLVIVLGIKVKTSSRKMHELAEKISLAITDEAVMPIQIDSSAMVNKVAGDFNKLSERYNALRNAYYKLKGVETREGELDKKLRKIEENSSQITMLTEIGRNITGSLKLQKIAETLYDVLYSTMDVSEMELLVKNEDRANKLINMAGLNNAMESENSILDPSENLPAWCMQNQRNAILGNAERDYGQYIYKPVVTQRGTKPQSAVVIPLVVGSKKTGVLAVYSNNTDNFGEYQIEFIGSIASYAAIAIENATIYGELEKSKLEVEIEKQRSDRLLLNILPKQTAEELKDKGKAEARYHENVTVLFTDFKEFTLITEKLSPEALVREIDFYFSHFDEIVAKYGIEKIKTIGDAYMCASGLPLEMENHAEVMIYAARDVLKFVTEYQKIKREKNELFFEIRIGINSGSVVSGVVGKSKFAYDIWGDAVNTAARMEQNGEPQRINISGSTYNLVKDKFKFVHRGKIEAKNKGAIDMYFLENE